MKRCALIGLLLATALAALAQDGAVFRSDVNLVNVLVTVRDDKGGVIGGLDKSDFKVLDSGQERDIVVFERRTDRPISVGLLLDASLSTAIELDFERSSAKRFITDLLGDGSHPQDRVAVMKFSEGVELLTGFTRSERALGRALDRIKPDTGTSLYDAVLLASDEVKGRGGRKVLIIITDGGDTTSYTSFKTAIEAAHNADVVIYSLIVQPIKADAGRNVGGENTLWMFAEGTGGKAFVEYGEAGLTRAFNEILENLRTQYLIGYYPQEHNDYKTRFREIAVKVDVPQAEVLARSGYYVPEERKLLPESVTPAAVETPQQKGRWRKAPGSTEPRR